MLLLAGTRRFRIRNPPCRQFRRLTERNEVPARHLVNGYTEPFPRNPLLEVARKKPIIAPNENTGWHGRPRSEGARRPKYAIGLARFPASPSAVNHRPRYVMEKISQRIERAIRCATVAPVL